MNKVIRTIIKKVKSWNGLTIAAVALFSLIFIFSIYRHFKGSRTHIDMVVGEHIRLLQKALNKVDKDCHIVDFEHEKNYIDFLNVVSFVGSEVGAVNLLYPDSWKGPYLRDNFTMQEQQYQVLANNQGHFIVPGPGVRLGNGKVIGKDIILTYDTDLQTLLKDKNGLMSHDDRALAVPIKISGSRIERLLQRVVSPNH